MPKTSSGKKHIDKIVVCGDSFSRPGQSGIAKVWSHYLEDLLGIEVVNLTWASGGSNSEILRILSEYVWTHDVQDTGFIAQWTTIDRLEFCDEEKEWFQVRQVFTKSGKKLPTDILMKIDKIKESQAYTYSESTYFWQFFQQVMTLDSIMTQNHCPYFQVYCLGDVLNDFFHQLKPFYFSQYHKQIYNMLSKTKWLNHRLIQADISNKGFSAISQDDPHFDENGHAQAAKTFEHFIHKEQWL